MGSSPFTRTYEALPAGGAFVMPGSDRASRAGESVAPATILRTLGREKLLKMVTDDDLKHEIRLKCA